MYDAARPRRFHPLMLATAVVVTIATPAASQTDLTRTIADTLRNDPAFTTPIRGNMTLPDTAAALPALTDRPGAAATRIVWRSSDRTVITATDRRVGRDVIRKGVVTRPASDRRVTLTATILAPGRPPLTVPIAVTVQAAPPAPPPPSAYLFAYFTGNTIDGEKIRLAISDGNNALKWKALNDAQPILESTAGTRGLRDPFIMRSAEGDRFFLLATDLSTGRSGWGGSTDHGSRYLEIWESTDLIHWGKQRHVPVNLGNAGMTWAPEASYDPTIGAYVVYWTSTLYRDPAHKVQDGDGPQILTAITRDFRTFTPPTPWFKSADAPGTDRGKGMIDATVLADGGRYYRFTKVTDTHGCPSGDILAQRSTALRATGTSGAWQVVDRCIGRRTGTPEVEGPTAFRANPGDASGFKYFLWVDDYGGVGYIPLATNALDGKIAWTYPRDFHLPVSPRHGTVLPITAPERDALLARWGAPPSADADVAASWVVPPVLAHGTRLPVPPGYTARWSIDGTALPDGILRNSGSQERTVRLSGTLTAAGRAPIAKTFTVRLLGTTAQRLVSYARTPTDAHDANQPTIARSIHLALGDAGAAPVVPLNRNYGIMFAQGDDVAIDRVALRGVADPSLFYFADGALGVIATRVDMAGTVDPARSATLVFRSDPAHPGDFTELGFLDLGTTDGVVRPRAVWDSSARHYVVSWTDRAGRPRWAEVQDLARTIWRDTPFHPETKGRRRQVATTGNVGTVHTGQVAAIATDDAATRTTIPNAEVTTTLPIAADVATALATRFGRIVNTTAAVAPRTITARQAATLRDARVRLDYSDGSHATRAVDWDTADLTRIAYAAPGRYVVHGTVRQRAYPAIFAYNRADPDIYRWQHAGRTRYLFVATDDTNNGNVVSPHLPLRIADTIPELADDNGGRAREVDLLNRLTRHDRTAEGRVIAGCYWAPELHEIGGKLSILFAPCFNPKDDQSYQDGSWSTVQSHIMQLRDGGDPANPADWSKPTAIRKPDGTALGRADMPHNISLDMSFVEAGKKSYYIWSQRYITPSGPLGDPLTWIAPVDPARPTRLTAAPTPIIAPTTSVEENLAEGAFALYHDGRITLTYSSSGVSPTYVVNGTSADARADLTSIDSWRKWPAPLQKSAAMPAGVTDYRRYEQGPGHGAFTTDEDGNELYVYHTWGNGVGGDGRDARVRRIHWSSDGRPLLNMTSAEEVAPANRRVTMDVTIR